MSDAAASAPTPPGGPKGGPAYAARLERAAVAAADSGLAGLIVTPGPDLDWLTGYRPPVTERLTA
ncbi:peptidase M24 family protein, partial [Streptomyces sp. AA8]|nr:peptidase M24 family protein [Streptomyces telluris]